MDLKGILAISGKPGLFKHISQTKSGIIVESLLDKKRMQAFSTTKVSALHDISVYTTGEDVLLTDIFKSIFKKENGGKSIDPKSSSDDLKKYMEEILPEYDKERVYMSDVKRLFTWYNILQEHGLVDLEDAPIDEKSEKKEEAEVKE